MSYFDCPDHPVIRNLENTGYPDGREPEEIKCPVCGGYAETFYIGHDRCVVGCDLCLHPIPYYEYEAEDY